MLVVGQKSASHYLAPAILRLGSTNKLLIRARGSLNISTAVDVAEIIKRDIQNLKVESIRLGTEEVPSDTVNGKRRLSFIEIQITKTSVSEVIPPVAIKKRSSRKKASGVGTKTQKRKKKSESRAGAA